MASSSGTSSGYSTLPNSGSEEDLMLLMMDERKRKRMISNRESARRSRLRKQKHLDDLAVQVSQLRNENQQILTSVNLTNQRYLEVESENSVLRAQLSELNNRFESLNEIINFMNVANGVFDFEPVDNNNNSFFNNPLLNMGYLNQPIMASAAADMMHY